MLFLIIIAICYALIVCIKKTAIPNEFLPIIAMCLGGLLSVGAFYIFPSIVPTDTLTATTVCGIMCGLASTGSNQVVKQMCKYILSKYGLTQVTSHEQRKDDNVEEE